MTYHDCGEDTCACLCPYDEDLYPDEDDEDDDLYGDMPDDWRSYNGCCSEACFDKWIPF
jgi:hypothetical protein